MRVGQVRRQWAPEAQGFEARLPMQLLLALATLLSVACTASGTCQPSQTDLATTLTIISSQQTKLQAQNAAYDGVVVRSPARKTVTRSIKQGGIAHRGVVRWRTRQGVGCLLYCLAVRGALLFRAISSCHGID